MALVLVSGGCLLQVTGCAAGFLPVVLSVVESAALSLITGGLFGP